MGTAFIAAARAGVGGREGAIGRDTRGEENIKEGSTKEERADGLAAKTRGASKLEPYLLVKESASLFL